MNIFQSISNLFFPSTCIYCDTHLLENEKVICTDCRHQLPLTSFTNSSNNLVEKAFDGRVNIIAGTALLFFKKKGISQELIHHLKYRNRQDIGGFFGEWIGEELKTSHRFNNLDGIVKVPLHPKKKKLRGYNQLTIFEKVLAKKLKIKTFDTVLIKATESKSQTKKDRLSRFETIKDSFVVKNSETLINKHILLIDDVITTGATLEACANELLKIKGVQVSIVTMVVADYL